MNSSISVSATENAQDDELLTIGQMAKINRITTKALRVYERMGILTPCRIDDSNGYRYYSYDQCLVLDMIQSLQDIGFSLSDIKEIVKNQDADDLHSRIREKLKQLNVQAEKIALAQVSANEHLMYIDRLKGISNYETVLLEQTDAIPTLRFPIEPYVFEPQELNSSRRLRQWEKSLCSIKNEFVTKGLLIALFHNVGCIISHESLIQRPFMVTGAFISYSHRIKGIEQQYWNEGYYLTVVVQDRIDSRALVKGGSHGNEPINTRMEYAYLRRLLHVARTEGFIIAGDYRCEVLYEAPPIFNAGRDMLLKLYLPVDLPENADSRALLARRY